jgi:hypothetical protein
MRRDNLGKFNGFVVLMALSLGAASCVSESAAGEGDLSLAVGGGAALQRGFPHTEGGAEFAFVDGWSMQFTKYVVVVGDVVLTDPSSGEEVGSFAGPVIVDLTEGGGLNHELTVVTGLPARRLDIGFSFLGATEGAANQNADQSDVEIMIAEGLSFLIEGEASRDSEVVGFRFHLPVSSRYYQCNNGVDQTRGIAIEANKTTDALIYAHALHLFWDTLAAGDEDLRFDAFAAVAGEDGVVDEQELLQQDLTDLRDAEGDPLVDVDGHRVVYNSGSFLHPDELNLLAFLYYAARAGVHFNGVGFCLMESLD